MKQVAGWYLPDHEKHLVDLFAHPDCQKHKADGRVIYQAVKQRKAMSYVKNWRTAVDIGGHVGTHSYFMAQRFVTVHAFEPVAEHLECFALNVTAPNVSLHPVALGAKVCQVSIITEPGSSGNSRVGTSGDIEMWTLDDFELTGVDYLKCDTEGFELSILMGAIETLKRCRPVMMIEQKPSVIEKNFGYKTPEAVRYLEGLGFRVAEEYSGDYMMVPT